MWSDRGPGPAARGDPARSRGQGHRFVAVVSHDACHDAEAEPASRTGRTRTYCIGTAARPGALRIGGWLVPARQRLQGGHVVLDTGRQTGSPIDDLVPAARRIGGAIESVIEGKPEAIRLTLAVLLA